MNLRTSIDLVRTKRTIAEPNPGFIIQLKAFEKVIFGSLSDVPLVLSKKPSPEVGVAGPSEETVGDIPVAEGSGLANEIEDGIQQLKLKGD